MLAVDIHSLNFIGIVEGGGRGTPPLDLKVTVISMCNTTKLDFIGVTNSQSLLIVIQCIKFTLSKHSIESLVCNRIYIAHDYNQYNIV